MNENVYTCIFAQFNINPQHQVFTHDKLLLTAKVVAGLQEGNVFTGKICSSFCLQEGGQVTSQVSLYLSYGRGYPPSLDIPTPLLWTIPTTIQTYPLPFWIYPPHQTCPTPPSSSIQLSSLETCSNLRTYSPTPTDTDIYWWPPQRVVLILLQQNAFLLYFFILLIKTELIFYEDSR